MHKVNSKEIHFTLRSHDSDLAVFNQVILDEEYLHAKNLLKMANIVSPLIIDLGSNIGLTSIYFHCYFEEPEILCVEPNHQNCVQHKEILKRNHIEGISIIERGIWDTNTVLAPNTDFRDGQSWSFSISEVNGNDKNGIETITFDEILQMAKKPIVDLLKIDIEGSEARLLGDATFRSLIESKVKVVVVEVHPEVMTKSHGADLLRSSGFVVFESTEFLTGINGRFSSEFYNTTVN